MSETITAWLWVGEGHILPHPPHTLIEPGKTFHATGPLVLTVNGLHGSVSALDALRYAPGFTVVRTVHSGEAIYGTDILCSRNGTALWIVDARMVVLDWLCAIVDRDLTREDASGRAPDPRTRHVLTTLRQYVDGATTLTEVRNATYAAASAANDADAAFHAIVHATNTNDIAAQAIYAAASAAASTARTAAYAARAAAIANAPDAAANAKAAAANAVYAARATHAIQFNHAEEWEWMNDELERRLIAAHDAGSEGPLP